MELAPPRPSTPLETERMRRETLQRTLSGWLFTTFYFLYGMMNGEGIDHSGREPKVSSVVDESLVQQPLELSLMEYPREEFETAIGIHDITLPRESIFEKASPEVEEEDWVDVEMDELYKFVLNSYELLITKSDSSHMILFLVVFYQSKAKRHLPTLMRSSRR